MKKYLAVFAILMMAATVQAATISPAPRIYFRNSAGTQPLSSGRVTSYEPGTSTPKATYTTSDGDVANTNPLILDSAGSAAFFLSGCYDLAISSSTGVPLYTTPNICEYEEATASSALTPQWNASGITPVFTGTTSFSTSGDFTDTFAPGLRLKSTTTAGTIYSTVVSAVYAATVTTVTVVNDSGVLDSGLSEVQISVLTVANPSMPIVPVATKTTGYTILPTDCGKTLVANLSSAATFTLPAASAVPSNCTITTKGTGTGALTLSGSIDNFSSVIVSNGATTTSFYGEATVFSSGSTSWFLRSAKGLPDGSNVLRTLSTTTAPNVIPLAGADGQIAIGFIPSMATQLTGTNGTNTWTVPAGITRMWAFLRGGGGGGATASGGSGSGGGVGYSITWLPLSVVSGETVTCIVGAGGTVGANGSGTSIATVSGGTITAGGGIAGTAAGGGTAGGTSGSLGTWPVLPITGSGSGIAQSDYAEILGFWPHYFKQAALIASGGAGQDCGTNKGGGNGGGAGGGTGGSQSDGAGSNGGAGTGGGGGGGGCNTGAGAAGGSGYCYLLYW